MSISSRNNNGIGIIGMGKWGRRIFEAIHQMAPISAVAHHGNHEAISWLAEHAPGVAAFTTPDELLAVGITTGVIIATPPNTHHRIASLALRSGYDVWCEKPVGTSLAEAEELVALAQQEKRILFSGYTFAYHPTFQKILDTPPAWKNIRTRWRKFGTFDDPLTYTMLCHDIALVILLAKEEPENIQLVESSGTETACDVMRVRLTFSAGRTAELSVNRTSDVREKIFVIDDTVLDLGTPASESPLTNEVRAFLQAIAKREDPLTDGSLAIKVHWVLRRLT